MFVGKHVRQLDSKGRLAIPAEYLNRLAPDERDELFVTPGENGCIWLLPKSFFLVMAENYLEAAADEIRDLFYQYTQSRGIDKAGRILLDDEAREYAGLPTPAPGQKTSVVICGSGRYMQVWDKDDYFARVKGPRDFAKSMRVARRAAEKELR